MFSSDIIHATLFTKLSAEALCYLIKDSIESYIDFLIGKGTVSRPELQRERQTLLTLAQLLAGVQVKEIYALEILAAMLGDGAGDSTGRYIVGNGESQVALNSRILRQLSELCFLAGIFQKSLDVSQDKHIHLLFGAEVFHDLRMNFTYSGNDLAALLEDSGLPGMRVLEFAFDPEADSTYLPHKYRRSCVCYAGSHDNPPIRLWKEIEKPETVQFAKDYLGISEEEGFNTGMIRGGMSSVAALFITQMQDWLELGEGCRMNTPGNPCGNWQWRMLPGEADDRLAKRIYTMTKRYGREA